MFSDDSEYFDENFVGLSDSSPKLQIQKEFLTYLDEEGILKDLKQAVNYYEKTVSGWMGDFIPPFRFQLKLDLIKMQEISENLMYLFVREPDCGMDLARDVIFCGIQLMSLNLELGKFDLQLVPLVKNLPVTCEISDLLQSPSLGLECVQGVLMNRTTVSKYVRSSVYSCPSQFCPNSQWRRYPENFGNVCTNCLNFMEEDISSTDTGEEIICQIIPLKAYQSPGRFQVLNVRVKDELCTAVDFRIGEEYKIAGKLTENFFEAMNVTSRQILPDVGLVPRVFPKSVVDLYYRISGIAPHCSWSFVYALSSLLASQLIPASAYLQLKMGLLLSLSTQKDEEPPCPLVAIGPDSLNTQYLFHTVGKLSERYVRHSIAHSYLGGAAKPGIQSDMIWLEAGQLVLAANGICNLGDWSKFKKEQADYICQTIESGQIVLNKGEFGKTDLTDFVPLKCAVWTYWCHITTSRKHQSQLKTLINVFGIPFVAEEKNDLEIKKICWKNLQKGKNISNSTTTIPTEDLKEFIKTINAKELCLTDTASQLIRNYFVVTRRERPHCLPLGAIKTITTLAEAHARLALRNEVLYEDAVAIIFLYEESISALFGELMNPYRKLIWDQKDPIYVFMGKQLQRFSVWLEEYVST